MRALTGSPREGGWLGGIVPFGYRVEKKKREARLGGAQDATTHLDPAEALLRDLNGRLDGRLSFELKREIVETLVASIRVETVEEDGPKEAVVVSAHGRSP